jgi:hypothetical protein
MTQDEYMEWLEDEVRACQQAHVQAQVRENTLVPEDEGVAHVRSLLEQAEEAGLKRCINGEAMAYWPYGWALLPGHIYSVAGVEEARISGYCEYHFDEMFAEEPEGDSSSPAGSAADTYPLRAVTHLPEL